MNDQQEQSLWLKCPLCGEKAKNKVYQNIVLIHFPLFCPYCKQTVRIDVVQLKMVLSKEPDA